MFYKNTASQKLYVYAYTPADGLPKTGDAAQITAYVGKDYGAATVLGDTTATEVDATNAPGFYLFDLTQAETNADVLHFSGKSSTSGVKVLGAPAVVFTMPTTGVLSPTTLGRTLDVSAGGEAGVDWANVGSPTTALDLSGTTIKTTQKVDVETIKTQAVTCAAGVTVRAHVGFAAAPGTSTGAPTVDASNRIAGMQGTINTFDGLNNLSSTATASAVWNALTSGMTTVGSLGKKLADWVVGTIDTYTGNTKQTGDAYARLGAPAGASVSADVAAVQADTDDIQTRIPAALTANGNMKSDVLRVNGTVQTAGDIAALINALQLYTTHVVARCTASGVPTTTSIPTSACSPAGSVADQFKGRIIVFDNDTTTAALRGQATDITASSAAATPTFTCTALTTAPASGDSFTIL